MTAVCLSKEGAPQVRLKRGPWGQAGGTAIHTRPANNNVGQSWVDHSSCGRSAPWSVYMIDTCFAGLQVVVNSSLGPLSSLDLMRYF